ncbi:MAG: squalene/phytoene synthase family protein [Pirellulales bacterium]|nr:squalene/phytoene synthase family protein [Pirellulales bacterium]
MNDSTLTIERSYRFCHAVARSSGSSFYPCFLVLPKPRRRAMEAIYAFMRHTDDLGDRPVAAADPVVSRLDELRDWRAALDEALLASPANMPTTSVGMAPAHARGLPPAAINTHGPRPTAHNPRLTAHGPRPDGFPALVDVIHRYHIPPEHFHAVIDGVEMDVRGRTYETFDELAEYCHRVASAVGLACIRVWGFRGAEPIEPARACGLAFQLTNILRDVKEDADAGRVYLPSEDLRRCGCSAKSLSRGETGKAFEQLMQLEMDRAKAFYRQGAALFDHLERPGRRILGMMMGVYYRLLLQIERDPAAVLRGQVRLGRLAKARLATRWLLLPPSRRALP